jgi:hypothetical protein
VHKNSVAHLRNDVTADILITDAVSQVWKKVLGQGHIHEENNNHP